MTEDHRRYCSSLTRVEGPARPAMGAAHRPVRLPQGRTAHRLHNAAQALEGACKRAGVGKVTRFIHDLRRTAVRAMCRAGLSEGEIMKLAGMKTRSIFDRYNITDEADLAEAKAAASSFNGKVPAKSDPSVTVSPNLSSSRSN